MRKKLQASGSTLVVGAGIALLASTASAASDGISLAEALRSIEEGEYAIAAADGALVAFNPSQRLVARFDRERVEVRPASGGDWRWTCTLEAWGRAGRLVPAERVEPRSAHDRVEYERGGVGEWYVNRPEGIEQGFTLWHEPSGAGELELALRFGGDLVAEEAEAGSFDLALDGEALLRYGEIVAYDARGAALPVSARLDERGLAIRVDDAGALYPVTVDPYLSSTPNHTIFGTGQDDRIGYSLASAGDIDADGFDDLLVGAPYRSRFEGGNWLVEAGAVFLFRGSANGPVTPAAWTALGENAEDRFGWAVSKAGHVNEDAHADIIVGAPFHGPNDGGKAYLYRGTGDAQLLELSWSWNGCTNTTECTTGDIPLRHVGYSVAGGYNVGDPFGNSYPGNINDDIVIGAPSFLKTTASPATRTGRAFVFYGVNPEQDPEGDGVSQTRHALTTGWGPDKTENARLGHSLALGNADVAENYAEIYVGIPSFRWDTVNEDGGVFKYSADLNGGSPGPFPDFEYTPQFFYGLGGCGGHLGTAVATVEPGSLDGYSLVVLMGAPDFSTNGCSERRGAVWIVGSGSPEILYGPLPNPYDSRFGASLSSAGDLNGYEGAALHTDILIGAPNYSPNANQTYRGRTFLHPGTPAGNFTTSAGWTYTGTGNRVFLGTALAGGFDVNGDDLPDVAMSAPHASTGSVTWAGAVHVFLGGQGGSVPEPLEADPGLAIRAMPSTFRGVTRVGFVAPVGAAAEVRVLDPTGSLVRRLVESSDAQGEPRFTAWDGCDEQGDACAPGRYAIELRSALGRAAAHVTLVR